MIENNNEYDMNRRIYENNSFLSFIKGWLLPPDSEAVEIKKIKKVHVIILI